MLPIVTKPNEASVSADPTGQKSPFVELLKAIAKECEYQARLRRSYARYLAWRVAR